MPEKENLKMLPEAYAGLIELAEDISHMTVVEQIDLGDREVIYRNQEANRLPRMSVKTASEKGKQKECPLCLAEQSVHGLVWEAYGESRDRAAALVAAQDNGLQGLTEQLVGRHFAHHDFVQPATRTRPGSEEQLTLAHDMSAIKQKIIHLVYRLGPVSHQQLIRMAMLGLLKSKSSDKKPSNPNSAKASIGRQIPPLTSNHMIYSYKHKNKKVYFPGAWCKPFILEKEDLWSGKDPISQPTQVKDLFIDHDLGIVDAMLHLSGQLADKYDNRIPVGGDSLVADMPQECWRSQRQLFMAYRTEENIEKTLTPDGFMTLRLTDGRHRQWQLPLFVEWDTGKKKIEDVVEQLIAFVRLARSGSIGKRLPQIGDCLPPVLMATSNVSRAERLAKLVYERADREGMTLSPLPLILITDHATLAGDAWAQGAWRNVFDSKGSSNGLADQLVDSLQPLIDANTLPYNAPVRIDLSAALPVEIKI